MLRIDQLLPLGLPGLPLSLILDCNARNNFESLKFTRRRMYLLQELNAANGWPFWEATKKREARMTVGVDKIGQFSNRSSTSQSDLATRFPNPLFVAGRPPNCMMKASKSFLSFEPQGGWIHQRCTQSALSKVLDRHGLVHAWRQHCDEPQRPQRTCPFP